MGWLEKKAQKPRGSSEIQMSIDKVSKHPVIWIDICWLNLIVSIDGGMMDLDLLSKLTRDKLLEAFTWLFFSCFIRVPDGFAWTVFFLSELR